MLYESGLQQTYTEVMVVYVPREIQIERLMNRDGLAREEAERRLMAQWPIDKKRKLADIVIDNGGSLEKTEAQVEEFLRARGLQ